jgi:hypothetical protein
LLERELLAIRQSEAPRIWFLTVGLPDFQLFYFEELALFQAYIRERMFWNNPAWQHKKFSFDHDGMNEYLPTTKRICNLYGYLPTTEIWNEHVLDNFLHQIAYVHESHLFENPTDFILLCDKLIELVDHIEAMAGQERRFAPGGGQGSQSAPWLLYSNEILRNNILMLVKTKTKETVYAVVSNPHFIKSEEPALVEYANQQFEMQMVRSHPLGQNGEKSRGAFFNKLRGRVRGLEKR